MKDAIGSHCPRWCDRKHHADDVASHQAEFDAFEGRWHHSRVLARMNSSDRGELVVSRELTTTATGEPADVERIVLNRVEGLTVDEAEQLAHILLTAASELRRTSTLRPV